MIKKMIQKFTRHSTVEIDMVLKLIENRLVEKKPKAEINGLIVNVSSLRLRTFQSNGITCACCGLAAEYFALERDIKSPEDQPYHLNLWGTEDGEPVLFTHDHTLARSLGGKDNLTNTTTMCCHCNWTKGDAEGILAQQMRTKK